MFPLTGNGRIMLILGSLLSALLSFASSVPLLGPGALLIGIGYFNAYYWKIVESTVAGEDEAPDWPEISSPLDDLVTPAMRTLAVYLISFLPAFLLLLFYVDWEGLLWGDPMLILSVLAGILYLPMALLQMIVRNETAAALPWEVIPAIRRALPGYFKIAGLLAVALFLSLIVSTLLQKVPFVGALLSAACGLYFAMAQARLAGRFYREHLDLLAGDEEKEESRQIMAGSALPPQTGTQPRALSIPFPRVPVPDRPPNPLTAPPSE